MSYKILLVGGGSGGHVFPLISVGRALQESAAKKGIELELELLGEGKFFEEAAENSGLKYKKILAGKFRRYLSLAGLLDPLKMTASFFQSFWYLFWLMPDAVFTKGGYASFFPALAAKIFFIPIYIHDSDAVPGSSNRIIGRWAKKVFVSFESAKKYFPAAKVELTGNPVRSEFLNGNKEEALNFFKFSKDLPTILVFGGSQGAKKINDIVLQSLIQLTNNFQVIHQCGQQNYEEVIKTKDQLMKEGGQQYTEQIKSRYAIYPFFNDREMAMAYTAADVVVSRSGAGSIFEVAALGKPAVIIPIKKSASDHQYFNALEFVKYGATMIEEDNLVTSVFVNEIKEAYQNKEELGQKIKKFAKLDAAEKIADTILSG